MPERFEPKDADYERIDLPSGYEGGEAQSVEFGTREYRQIQDRLLDGSITVEQWYENMERAVSRRLVEDLAWGIGKPPSELDDTELGRLRPIVNHQLSHLRNWRDQLMELPEGQMPNAHISRIDQYGVATAIAYRLGRTIDWPLPAMPGEGSICRIYCKCKWRVDVLDAEAGDADAYWDLGATEHCATCITRNGVWNPLQIRGGEIAW